MRRRDRSAAAKRAAYTVGEGDASCVIAPVDSFPRGSRVALWCRTSTGDGQDVDAQRFALRAECERLGFEVVGWRTAVVSLHADSDDARWTLNRTIRFARDAGAVLVARDATRFLRRHDSKPLRLRLASGRQWAEFTDELRGVRVATLFDPAAGNATIVMEAGRLALKYRAAFARSRKSDATEEQKRVALELHGKGWKASEIAPFVDVAKRTVNRWVGGGTY